MPARRLGSLRGPWAPLEPWGVEGDEEEAGRAGPLRGGGCPGRLRGRRLGGGPAGAAVPRLAAGATRGAARASVGRMCAAVKARLPGPGAAAWPRETQAEGDAAIPL
jgi:hypothetical protein